MSPLEQVNKLMPKHTVPGVYVEEVSTRTRSIEGVSTATAGFVGAACYGPLTIAPEIITSLVAFERVYGGGMPLEFGGGVGIVDNYLWHSVRAFFEEGGKRLYVARAFSPLSPTDDGRARAVSAPGVSSSGHALFDVAARYPGKAGNGRVTFTFQLGPNHLVDNPDGSVSLHGALDRDVVFVSGAAPGFRSVSHDALNKTWRLLPETGPEEELQSDNAGTTGVAIRTLTVAVTFHAEDSEAPTFIATGFPLDPAHESSSVPDSIFACFAPEPASRVRAGTIPLVITPARGSTGLTVTDDFRQLYAVQHASPDDLFASALLDRDSPLAQRSVVVHLSGGNDGLEPAADKVAGRTDALAPSGLVAFEPLEDISVVAAPGATRRDTPETRAIIAALIGHAERMRYRIAVIDSVRGQSIAEVRALRALYDSSYAAFYYPWVRIVDPATGAVTHQPPCGFIAGIYARNDAERGVWKAPANEVVTLATGFETLISQAQQAVLNPEGVNCFCFFDGRGMRLWGARTMSNNPEWKYVNVRRYCAYLERSIDKGTLWSVFEPNDARLWANIRSAISGFLLNEWRNGALLGDRPEQAFFVKCDRSTMSQDDLYNGRVVCLIGVAPIRPAEFVILRIGQWTANRKV